MNKDVSTKLEEFSSPRVFLTQTHELDPTELANKEANPTE